MTRGPAAQHLNLCRSGRHLKACSWRGPRELAMPQGPSTFFSSFSFLFVALVAPAFAEPCDTPAHRAFDFWLGHWEVRTPDGKLVGMNVVERGYGGCVLHERYTTERGYRGESLNAYDGSRDVWHQTWVDSAGALLLLEGGLRDDAMVLEGQTVGKDGTSTKHRITWSATRDSGVRQLWQSTNAKGEWTISFDGRYTRK